jgi:hypothetical protein
MKIQRRWGRRILDAFAAHHNRQFPRYWSRLPVPQDKRSVVRIVARSENTAETTTEAQSFAALQQENMKLQENNNALLTQLVLLNQSNDAQTQQIVKLNNELSGFRLTFDRLEQSLADMTMKYSTLISQLHPTGISQPAPNDKTQTTLQTTTASTTIEDPISDGNHSSLESAGCDSRFRSYSNFELLTNHYFCSKLFDGLRGQFSHNHICQR